MRAGLLLVLAALLSAGCVGGDEPVEAAEATDRGLFARSDPASAPGSIEGVVTSVALEPIAGARVTLLRENVSTTTDAAGFFRFADLANGAYLVSASADGFVTRTVQATATNGTVFEVNLTLDRARIVAPYAQARELRGLLACGAEAHTPVGPRRVDCGAADANHRDRFEIDVEPDGKSAVLELSWDAASHPGASRLRLVVETVGYGAADLVLGEAVGEGYARVEVARAPLEKYYAPGGRMRALVELAPGQTPAAAAVQVPFTLYVTVFHVEPGPAGYSVLRP